MLYFIFFVESSFYTELLPLLWIKWVLTDCWLWFVVFLLKILKLSIKPVCYAVMWCINHIILLVWHKHTDILWVTAHQHTDMVTRHCHCGCYCMLRYSEQNI